MMDLPEVSCAASLLPPQHAVFCRYYMSDVIGLSTRILALALERLVQARGPQSAAEVSRLDTFEPEMLYDGVAFHIPRQCHDHVSNMRHLANRQSVTNSTSLNQAVVQVLPPATGLTGSRFRLICVAKPPHIPHWYGSTVNLRVRHSSLAAIRVAGAMFLRLVLGREVGSNRRMLALSSRIASQVIVPASWAWPVGDSVQKSQEPCLLQATATALLARYLTEQVPPFRTLLVHEPGSFLPSVLSQLATQRNVTVIYSTSMYPGDKQNPMIFLHEHSTKRQLNEVIPANISAVAVVEGHKKGIRERILDVLPNTAIRSLPQELFLAHASIEPTNREDAALAANAFMTSCLAAQHGGLEAVFLNSETIVSIASLAKNSRVQPNTIVDWDTSGPIETELPSASSRVRLSGSKTYVLIGFTGELARILCLWLAAHGAKWILLTSPDSNYRSSWLEQVAKLGAKIILGTVNLSDGVSIHNLGRSIVHPLPSTVGGVLVKLEPLLHGALSELTAPLLRKHLHPLVRGIHLLNQLHEGESLDFWVLFGSIAGNLGRKDQAMTVALSEAMASLVRQRRIRNRPASLVYMGEIRGIGADDASPELFPPWGPAFVSQRDVDEVLAEAILCGGLDCTTRDAMFIAGLRQQRVQGDGQSCPIPKLWPFYLLEPTVASPDAQGSAFREPWSTKELVNKARSQTDKAEAIGSGFMHKIRSHLKLAKNSQLSHDTVLSELGVDSLVAVELCQWFSKEVGVDVPVVWILSGVSVGQLVISTAAKLCRE